MQIYAILARLFCGATLIITWGLTNSPLSGVVFVLCLAALSALRYRVRLHLVLCAAEAAVCVAYAFFWLPALLGLWLPLIGLLENKWQRWEREILEQDNDIRAEKLKLEKKQNKSMLEARNAAQLAQINERGRIAQDIHDHVGHEITGALIALQTAAKLYESGDERAGELLSQSISRLESASESLRETVHNLRPLRSSEAGIDDLRKLCDNFTFCEISFTAAGDLENIKHSDVLTANLKEALTNISRHSNAASVNVKIDGNAEFVRLSISDNGKVMQKKQKTGMGINGMKERVRNVNGTLSINTSNGFQIICVIPKGDKI